MILGAVRAVLVLVGIGVGSLASANSFYLCEAQIEDVHSQNVTSCGSISFALPSQSGSEVGNSFPACGLTVGVPDIGTDFIDAYLFLGGTPGTLDGTTIGRYLGVAAKTFTLQSRQGGQKIEVKCLGIDKLI